LPWTGELQPAFVLETIFYRWLIQCRRYCRYGDEKMSMNIPAKAKAKTLPSPV
jgi:hypothetical protein